MAICRACSECSKGFARAPGLLFIVFSFLINIIVWSLMTASLEKWYVFAVWVSAGFCTVLWAGSIVWISVKQKREERTEIQRRNAQLSAERGELVQVGLDEKKAIHSVVSRNNQRLRLRLYIASTAACMAAGLALGPWGLHLLTRDKVRPSERVAIVMLNMTVQWVQGIAEFFNLLIHLYALKTSETPKTNRLAAFSQRELVAVNQ